MCIGICLKQQSLLDLISIKVQRRHHLPRRPLFVCLSFGVGMDKNFDAVVSKCILRRVLTKDIVRTFSQKARHCMLTYKSLELEDTNKNIDPKNETKNLITLVKIESVMKVLKSHQAALDLDKDFIMGSISKVGFILKKRLSQSG